MLRLLLACLFMSNLYGQNQHKLFWEAAGFDLISLELPFANTIVVSTSLDNSIALDYQTEGEYKNHLVMRSFQMGKSLQLVEQKGPSFNAFHDKLSAHKVWASTLKLFLPEHFKLQLKVQNARLEINGNFSNLSLKIHEGEVILKGQDISGNIETHNAGVRLFGDSHKASAQSKYGSIYGPFKQADQSQLHITSVKGNISLISQRK
ncbi:MAG: hypothetical protein VW943_01065 [Flavobacteriaceae bacterium]